MMLLAREEIEVGEMETLIFILKVAVPFFTSHVLYILLSLPHFVLKKNFKSFKITTSLILFHNFSFENGNLKKQEEVRSKRKPEKMP